MLNLAGIDEALKMLAIKKRFRFNAHQVAYLSGNSDVKEVYNYLVSKEPYIIYRRYEIQCPDNLDATGSYSSEAEIPEEWMECRICGCEFIPDKDLAQIVFYFTEQYLQSLQIEGDCEKKFQHPLNIAV